MWVQHRQIDEIEASDVGRTMCLSEDEITAMSTMVGQSRPALMLTMADRPFVVLGFIPIGLLTSSAYVWMQWTPEIYDRPIAATRQCIEVFTSAKQHYRQIYGHCSYGPKPMRLFTRLGARFSIDPIDGRPCFIIEADNVPS